MAQDDCRRRLPRAFVQRGLNDEAKMPFPTVAKAR